MMSTVALCTAILWRLCYSKFQCLPSNETTTIYYQNHPNTEALLPTVRFVQGMWDSQWAMQYAASIYLKEKIGVNVSFYPSDDPQATNEYSNLNYPHHYWQWIAEDKYDLMMEMWEIIEETANGTEYYREQTVLHGGLSKVFGEQTFFVPAYIYQHNSDWVFPEHMVHNQEARNAYINAAAYNASRDWVNYSIATNVSVPAGYDLATYTKPIVWGSVPGYVMSAAGKLVVDNLLNGTWDYVPLGSEAILSEFVKDLYVNKLPFVATIYDPHADFSTIINETTGEKMDFETVMLPRNPSNSDQDECVLEGMCAFSKTPLLKLGNPKFREEFPEMIDFLHAFKMTTREVNFIIMEHIAAANMNLTEHEKWQYAACQWLKKTTEPIDENTGEIKRFLCDGGASQLNCVRSESLSSLEVIIFGLSGFIGFVLIVWIVYKVSVTCKEFQDGFVSTDGESDARKRMLIKERRRIFISMVTSSGSVVVGLADFASDAGALAFIMKNRSEYTEAFMVTYFVLTMLAAIVSTAHILVTLQIIISDGWMLKSNRLIDEIGGSKKTSICPPMQDQADKRSLRRDSITQDGNKAIARLKFKKRIIEKKIKEQTANIFVGLIEDIPFYVMNMIALLGDVNSSGEDNAMFLVSLSITAMSVGFKVSIARELFNNLGDKGDIKEQILSFESIKHKRSVHISQIFRNSAVIPLHENAIVEADESGNDISGNDTDN